MGPWGSCPDLPGLILALSLDIPGSLVPYIPNSLAQTKHLEQQQPLGSVDTSDFEYSQNSECLRGSNGVSVPGANYGPFSRPVPVSVFMVSGRRFMRMRGTW